MGWDGPRYTEQDVRAAVASARSLSEALRTLGLRAAGNNFQTLERLIESYDISTAHMDPNWVLRGDRPRRTIPLEQVMVEDSNYSRGKLKRRLYQAGLKQRRCEFCGQGETWRGRWMSLILDHVNGIATDNRLENLRIVCPNCNATLDTHCGRQNRLDVEPRLCLHCSAEFMPKYPAHRYCSHPCGVHSKGSRTPKPETRKVARPPYERLTAELAATNFSAVGRGYGVSGNAARKSVRWYKAEQERGLASASAGAGDEADGGPDTEPHPSRTGDAVIDQGPEFAWASVAATSSNRSVRSHRITP